MTRALLLCATAASLAPTQSRAPAPGPSVARRGALAGGASLVAAGLVSLAPAPALAYDLAKYNRKLDKLGLPPVAGIPDGFSPVPPRSVARSTPLSPKEKLPPSVPPLTSFLACSKKRLPAGLGGMPAGGSAGLGGEAAPGGGDGASDGGGPSDGGGRPGGGAARLAAVAATVAGSSSLG